MKLYACTKAQVIVMCGRYSGMMSPLVVAIKKVSFEAVAITAAMDIKWQNERCLLMLQSL